MYKQLRELKNDELLDNESIEQTLIESADQYGIPVDFLHYIALVGIFPPSRNILKNWQQNEPLFLNLVKREGKTGRDHFLQSLIIFFVRNFKEELTKYAPTFMKKLVDENIMSEKFLLEWYDKEIRLDKDSLLYDKKAEKQFREMIEQFVEWLK